MWSALRKDEYLAIITAYLRGRDTRDGRRTTLVEDGTCREAAYLNFRFQPTGYAGG